MQAFGFEKMAIKGEKQTKEKLEALLQNFLDRGYFLIDACPEPIEKPIGVKNLSAARKTEAMMNHVETLLKVIDDLKPEKIVFLCKTNESVAKWLVKNTLCMVPKSSKMEIPIHFLIQGMVGCLGRIKKGSSSCFQRILRVQNGRHW